MKKAFALLMVCLSNIALFANHWTPESAAYSDNMALYCVIQINGEEQHSDQLEVGVFCGDECRGSAIVSEFWLTHRYLAIVTIYGENGHQLTFKLYDHGLGEELELTSPAAITFDVDGYGNPIEPYVLNFTGEPSEVTQTITLSQGWNWISAYVEADDLLEQLEKSLGDNGVQIKSKTLVTAWDEDEEEWMGSLQNVGLSNDKTYLVQTTASCQVTLVGQACVLADYTITLNPGWNWIGFPSAVAVSLEEAFSGFEAVEGDQIKSKTFVAGWDSDEDEWSGTLTVLTLGQGYMFYSATSGARTLTFQTGSKSKSPTKPQGGN